MAKIITLIGDEIVAAGFVAALKEHRMARPDFYKINNQVAIIKHEPNIERVVRQQQSAIVHVKSTDRPDSLALINALPLMPKDYTYIYRGEPPLNFVQEFIGRIRACVKPSFTSRLTSLFGASTQEPEQKASLPLRFETAYKTPAGGG